MGLEADGRLYRVMDIARRKVSLPAGGVVLSEKLAEVLAVGIGDRVTVEVLEGRRPICEMPITGLVADFAGTAAYMDIRAMNRLMEEGDTISGAFLAVDPEQIESALPGAEELPARSQRHH